ncbi:adenosine-specific kinase [Geochorda subterranea]|uniref:Adenosine-specific kinase n=1 Tax=Geochorda subterranea TaxID=3109564 RepID=A0ABZ1BML2_9FIRM|nr:adenosine-specific kinase [Limnochorda sp. LNt]WRP14066.1 adenosine-specific kinase [Limnochorda sp. LNt]
MVQLELVPIDKPDEANVILGQSHFIKTVEDLHEAMANAGGRIRFGIAFNEASGPCLVRHSGNDARLEQAAVANAQRVGAGHFFVIVMEDGFPINVLNAIKQVPEVCRIFCATANPVQVVVAETDQGRGVLGVVDGLAVKGVEGEQEIQERKALLRRFGYKL